MNVDDHHSVTEPVGWGSHLARKPGIGYTELAGMPVLIDPESRDIQALTAAVAGIWAQLDGRELAVALGIDPDSLGPTERRNLIEVIRRLKARGLVVDVAPDAPLDPGADLLGAGTARSMDGEFRGLLEQTDGWTLRISRSAATRVKVRLEVVADQVRVTFRRHLRRRNVDHIVIDDDHFIEDPRAPLALAAFVAALEDSQLLSSPGTADLLADLAEHVAAHGSLRH